MKKLIVAFAAVAMAACSHAAVVTWGSGTITAHATGSTAGKNAVTMLCWEITSTQYDMYAKLSGSALSDAINSAFSASSAELSISTSNRGLANDNGTTTHSAGDVVYGAVLFVDAADNYYLGNVVTATIPGSGNGSFNNLFTTYGGTASSGSLAWSTASVPEPTSGLLLLLGMAGLALKRKRA